MSIDAAELRRGKSIFWTLLKDHTLPDVFTKITGCRQYIACFAVDLGLTPKQTHFAKKLFKELHKRGVGASKQPQSVAAGCLFSICEAMAPQTTIDHVAQVCGVSKATIKDVVRISRETNAEPLSLLAIFVCEICDVSQITNPLTREKCQIVAKDLLQLLQFHYSLWELSAFAVFFVLTIYELRFNVKQLDLKEETIVTIARFIVPYRDDIIQRIGGGRVAKTTSFSSAPMLLLSEF